MPYTELNITKMIDSEIIKEFDERIKKSGRQFYNEFYVGITTNIEERLFTDHRVQKEGNWWMYAPADTEAIARDVEKHYLEYGMRGDTGGGTDKEGKQWFVYCYIITRYTIE